MAGQSVALAALKCLTLFGDVLVLRDAGMPVGCGLSAPVLKDAGMPVVEGGTFAAQPCVAAHTSSEVRLSLYHSTSG